MKIINATWEKRNMGVEAMEYDIDPDDGAEVIPEILQTERDYNVVRVPAGNVTALKVCQSNGYMFEEAMISIVIDAAKFKALALPAVQFRMINALSYTEMTERDLEYMFAEIRGGIFENDRISKDPHFGPKLAAERFIGWMGDEISRGSKVFNVVYKEQNIGFFLNRQLDNGDCIGVLFGMYNDWKKSGLGIGGVYISLKQAFDNGAKRFLGNVSSNNSSQLRLDMAIGFEISEIKYILTKNKE